MNDHLIPTVNAVKNIGSIGKGVSQSHIIYCDDKNRYVVKFSNDLKSDKTAANELIAGSLARELGLPLPEIRLIYISQKLIDLNPEFSERGICEGLHFGSIMIDAEDLDNMKIDLKDHKIVNQTDLYGVIAFDNWLINGDRANGGNNMIQRISSSTVKYWMIDLGYCFANPNWDTGSLKTLFTHDKPVAFHSLLSFFISDASQFDPHFELIETLSNSIIEAIINDVPPQWPVSEEERKTLFDFIKIRKDLPRNIINNNKGMISAWIR